jgi:transposase
MAEDSLLEPLWQRLEPLLPRPRRRNRHVQFAGRKPTDPRRVLTGILFVLRTGIPWRALPVTSDFPSGFTCWRHLRRWHKQGIWRRLLENLLAELHHRHGIDWTRAMVDSASLRAPAGGQKTGPNPTDRRKRGSKHHLLTDRRGVPLAIILTKANRNDICELLPLLQKIPRVRGRPGRPRQRPDAVQGDRGYDSNEHRRKLKKRG